MTMGAKDSFTIDELAQAAGMTPRNVRAYRTKGLLSPPIRVGRTSRYRTAHLDRLRDIRQLREAGLPLKLIIEAAQRGEDLGPEGTLWLAAGRIREPSGLDDGTGPDEKPAFVRDPQAYALMQILTKRGLTPGTVLLLALRTARATNALAMDISELLRSDADRLPTPEATVVIDLATVITREMLGNTLTMSTG
jgi:DNA-binding transcriptional MerR regulator